MKANSLILFGILFYLSPLSLQAQERLIEGTVLERSTGLPLVGAHVMLQSNWKIGTVSDSNGAFEINVSSAISTDSLIISFVGYTEQVLALRTFNTGQGILLVERSNAMQEVEIVGEKLIAEEFSIQKIERIDIYKNPSAKADVLLAVNALPSSTTVDETANVSFRGSNPAQTGIYFNQVPVYDAVRFSQLNGIGTFSFFNTEIVNNVQVFAGNPPLEFGNTTSGLVAIQSEDQLVSKRYTSLLASLASIAINHRQKTGARSSLVLFGNYQFSAPLKSINEISLDDILKFKSIDAGIHWVHHSPNKLSVKVFNYVLDEGYDYNFRSPSYNGVFQQSRFNNLTVVNIVKKLDAGTLSINLGNRWSHQLFNYSKAIYDISNLDLYGSIQYQKENKYSGIKLGVVYDGRFQEFKGIVPEFHYAQGLTHPFKKIEPTSNQREVIDLYLYYKVIPTENLTIGMAARKNIPWNNQDHYLSRQLNIDYRIHPLHRLKFATGTFNQHILPQDIDGPIRLKAYQMSLDYQYNNGTVMLNTSIFHKRTDVENAGKEINSGFEVALNYVPLPKLFFDISYTGLMIEREFEGLKYHSIYDLPYFIRMGLEWNFIKMYTLGLRGVFRKGIWYKPIVQANYQPGLNAYEPVYASPGESNRYPGYNLLDATISSVHALGESVGLVLFMSVGNIFNFQNVRQYSYNWDYTVQTEKIFSSRTVYFGAMVTF